MQQPHVPQHDVAEDVNTSGYDNRPTTGVAEVENPFSFTPQLIRLHKDHELFEVTNPCFYEF